MEQVAGRHISQEVSTGGIGLATAVGTTIERSSWTNMLLILTNY